MKPVVYFLFSSVLSISLLPGCDNKAGGGDLKVEKLPDVRPNLPEVPTLPPPPFPVQHADGSYSVYGLRKRVRTTIDTELAVTGYIVEVYKAPECPKDQACPPPSAPHMWIADKAGETDSDKRLTVVGYAENQAEIDEATAKAKHGQYKPPPPESGLLPIPTDFAVGAKVKVQGKFTRMSGSGFNQSEGLLEYRGHQTLQPAS